jgi:hypothetical protein
MKRAERIKRFARAIQSEIVSCPNEQSFDEGDTIWISGSPTDIPDLLMQHDVPEDMEEEVVARLHCPACGSPLEPWQEVGTKYSFESTHEFTVGTALRKYDEKLHGFDIFLLKSPMSGFAHPLGKTIIREIRKAPRTALHKPMWYRARATKEYGFGVTPVELVPDQRYNSSGIAHWYFADNPECAVAEIDNGGAGWVQRFEIDGLTDLLDLRSWKPDDPRVLDEEGDYHPPHGLLLAALIYGDFLAQMYYPELPNDREKRKWKPEYLVSRFVAEAARHAGFKGILCGSTRYPGENLIVFDSNWAPKTICEPIHVTLDADGMKTVQNYIWNQGEGFVLPDFP